MSSSKKPTRLQINFRCTETEKEAYDALADELETALSQIIREQLDRLVKRHLGEEWLAE